MYLEQFVNKKVVRTKPIISDHIVKDISFIDEPIFIVKADKNEVIYKFVNGFDDREYHLISKYMDDNWKEFKK